MRIIYCPKGHRVVVDEVDDPEQIECGDCRRLIEPKVFKAKRTGES